MEKEAFAKQYQKTTGNFTKIENYLIRKNYLSDSAFRTLVVLKSHKYGDNEVFPSIETIAKERGKSKRTIVSHLQELRRLGLIKTKRRTSYGSNLYTFCNDRNNYTENPSMEENYPTQVQRITFKDGNKLPPNNTHNEEETDNKDKKNSAGGFEKFAERLKAMGIKK